ncbi:hypothetical protein M6D81_28320 [Paenibacillus sp. J5C_2022]|uniref:hypothetical protein n=1 Tax=Paenibacillus sp. J5C2022 TaxID=2977129 RepID=UPI0021D1DF86|nr:hypothetical protein [Paenibacillus sp. J5C2022]MCU6712611.1 hypothetical protein [Paenibacillus sp. J5C2022]
MKRWIVVPAAIFLASSVMSGYLYFYKPTLSHKPSIEMQAYAALNDKEKGRVPVSPKDAAVAKVTVDEGIAARIGSHYIGTNVYSVMFNQTSTASSGNLVVYIDMNRTKVLGKGSLDEAP